MTKLMRDESNNISFFIVIFSNLIIYSIYKYHHTNFMSLNIGVFLGSRSGNDKKI